MAATTGILLVEDNPATIYLVKKALAEYGQDIPLAVVTDAKAALAYLRHEAPFAQAPCPGLIISDLHFPRLHGYELLAEVHRMPAHHTTPVVIFSGADKEIEEARCLRLGATAYVQKPADPYDFFAAIRAMVTTWLPQERVQEEKAGTGAGSLLSSYRA